MKSPVLSVGFYPPGEIFKQEHLFIKFINQNGDIKINDIKVTVGPNEKTQIKYSGYLNLTKHQQQK